MPDTVRLFGCLYLIERSGKTWNAIDAVTREIVAVEPSRDYVLCTLGMHVQARLTSTTHA